MLPKSARLFSSISLAYLVCSGSDRQEGNITLLTGKTNFATHSTKHLAHSSFSMLWQKVFQQDSTLEGGAGLLDGCAQVYLDIGSNVGVQVRKLFEPSLYPGAPVLEVFNRAFGDAGHRSQPSSQSGLCAVGFEANPARTDRLREIEQSYKHKGWRVDFFVPKVVSNVGDETVTLWTNGLQHNSWGASTRKNIGIHAAEGQAANKVPTLDLTEWVLNTVKPRSLPTMGATPYVLAKFDIEGSEYEVLPRLMKHGALCAPVIQKAFIEFHQSFLKGPDKQKHDDVYKQVMDKGRCGNIPTTEVTELDDETFNMDGKPLPSAGS